MFGESATWLYEYFITSPTHMSFTFPSLSLSGCTDEVAFGKDLITISWQWILNFIKFTLLSKRRRWANIHNAFGNNGPGRGELDWAQTGGPWNSVFEISITGTAWRRNMVFGVVWVSVAGGAVCGACGLDCSKVLRHRLRHTSFAFRRLAGCLLALPLAHFYSLRTEKSGQKRV